MKHLTRSLLAVTISLFCLQSQAQTHAHHWGYTGEAAPAHWAELDSAFEACGVGHAQSPINIDKVVKTHLPALDFQYQTVAPTFINNGHTIQVNIPAGQKVTVGDHTYELMQFHFHTPSEETVHGKHAAMVAHFVHKNENGELGVVAVLIQPGAHNAAFDPVFKHLPRTGETISVQDLALNLSALLPQDKKYYSFEGSLTTPPCSEGVHWMVVETPVKLGKDQIKAFRQLFKANARPTQALNDRTVFESE